MRLSSSSCSLSLLCSCFQTLAKTSQNPKILLAIMALKPVSCNLSLPSIPSPPRPIIHKTFGYLTQLNLSSVGLGLNDIPYPFGWELMVYVGTIPVSFLLQHVLALRVSKTNSWRTQKPLLGMTLFLSTLKLERRGKG